MKRLLYILVLLLALSSCNVRKVNYYEGYISPWYKGTVCLFDDQSIYMEMWSADFVGHFNESRQGIFSRNGAILEVNWDDVASSPTIDSVRIQHFEINPTGDTLFLMVDTDSPPLYEPNRLTYAGLVTVWDQHNYVKRAVLQSNRVSTRIKARIATRLRK